MPLLQRPTQQATAEQAIAVIAERGAKRLHWPTSCLLLSGSAQLLRSTPADQDDQPCQRLGTKGAAGLRWNTQLHDRPALDGPEYARDRIAASWRVQQFFRPAATEPGLRHCDPVRQPALDIECPRIGVRRRTGHRSRLVKQPGEHGIGGVEHVPIERERTATR